MVPSQLPPPSSSNAVQQTVPVAVIATLGALGVVLATFWPIPAEHDPLAITEFDDGLSGRQQLIVPLGEVDLGRLPPGAQAAIELRLQSAPPAQHAGMTAGVTLVAHHREPTLLEHQRQARIAVGTIEGPVLLSRIEIDDNGTIISGLYGELPWGLVIGLATGAPASLHLGDDVVTFPASTQQQVLKALRRARALGHPFETFGVDITQDQPTSPLPAVDEPAVEEPAADEPAPAGAGPAEGHAEQAPAAP